MGYEESKVDQVNKANYLESISVSGTANDFNLGIVWSRPMASIKSPLRNYRTVPHNYIFDLFIPCIAVHRATLSDASRPSCKTFHSNPPFPFQPSPSPVIQNWQEAAMIG